MKGLVIWVRTGEGSDESILDEIGMEISGRGGRVEVFHREAAASLGIEDSERARAAACAMLAGHGVIVITGGSGSPGISGGERLEVRDIPEGDLQESSTLHDFMRELELSGLIPPPKYDVHPDEEKEIIRRLQDLGYLDD